MQVLKRRNNKRIALSLFQSSWHILSIQNENASGCCVVFLPWTCIPESSKIMSYCFLNIYFFSSALRKEVSTLLSSGISGDLCVRGTWLEQESAQRVLWAASPRVAVGLGWPDPLTSSCLAPLRPTAGSQKAAGVDWVDWRGAGFGSEPWCCQCSGPESGLSLEHSHPKLRRSDSGLKKPYWPFSSTHSFCGRGSWGAECKWLTLGQLSR